MAKVDVSPAGIQASSPPMRRRSSLDLVMLLGLSIAAALDALAQLISAHIIPPVLIVMIVYLVSAVVVATGWRWSMFFPLIFCTLGIVGDFSSGYPGYTLVHPSSNYLAFVVFVISYPVQLVAISAAGVKLAQTLRRETPRAPRWLTPLVTSLIGLSVGALVIGVIAQSPSASGAASATAGTETVHLTTASFAPNIVALHSGDTLTLVDDAPVPHTITNGTWSADNKPVPGVEPGAPIIRNVDLNANSATVGPFTTPGTYHIYCTVHPGMVLTIIVQ